MQASELSLSADDRRALDEVAASVEVAGDRYGDMSFVNR
jgi:hypothetical protein